MNSDQNFTFISPIPYPIESAELLDGKLRLDNFSAQECVQFFWRVKRVYLNAELSIFYQGENWDEPLYDETVSTSFDSTNTDCIFGVSMRERVNYTNLCNITNEHGLLEITGPYLSNGYETNDIDFSQKKFEYHLRFYFGVGNIVMSSEYIANASNPDAMITAQRFPFEIFGRTYHLNLNVPNALLTPEKYGIITSFSGNAELLFEFL